MVFLILWRNYKALKMTHEIDPPSSDELIVRHAFYAKVSSGLTNHSKEINSVANNLRVFVTDFEVIKNEVKATETRNKTIITVAAIVWTVIGGSIGLYIGKGLDSFEKQTQKLRELEYSMSRRDTDFQNYKENTKRDFSDIRSLILTKK